MTGDTEKLVGFLLRHVPVDADVPLGGDVTSWEDWMLTVFHPQLKPVVEKAARAAANGLLEDLLTIDLLLDDYSESDGRHCPCTSRELGDLLLENLGKPASLRILDRFRNAVEEGNTPGHAATVLGMAAGLFHIAPNVAGTALAYLFWRNRFARDDATPFPAFATDYVNPPESSENKLQAVNG